MFSELYAGFTNRDIITGENAGYSIERRSGILGGFFGGLFGLKQLIDERSLYLPKTNRSRYAKLFTRRLKGLGVGSRRIRKGIVRGILDNFDDYESVQIRRIKRERSFWRRWDGKMARKWGRYGAIGPRNGQYARRKLSVRTDWNELTYQTRFRIRKGGLLVEGSAAPKVDVDGTLLPGKGHQLFVPFRDDLYIP
jgi:hypothetical protein